jgi:hypothetical protein
MNDEALRRARCAQQSAGIVEHIAETGDGIKRIVPLLLLEIDQKQGDLLASK